MYIGNVIIKNFRALNDVQFEFGPRINVIVGPNGVGKTTVLQALRLVKALLAARTQSEALQTLISLGAASPHFPQRMFLPSLARDPARPIEIKSTYHLRESDLVFFENFKSLIVNNIIQSRMGQSFANAGALIQFLSSPQGMETQRQVEVEVRKALENLALSKYITLGIIIDLPTGEIKVVDPVGGLLVGYLDQERWPGLFEHRFAFYEWKLCRIG